MKNTSTQFVDLSLTEFSNSACKATVAPVRGSVAACLGELGASAQW